MICPPHFVMRVPAHEAARYPVATIVNWDGRPGQLVVVCGPTLPGKDGGYEVPIVPLQPLGHC